MPLKNITLTQTGLCVHTFQSLKSGVVLPNKLNAFWIIVTLVVVSFLIIPYMFSSSKPHVMRIILGNYTKDLTTRTTKIYLRSSTTLPQTLTEDTTSHQGVASTIPVPTTTTTTTTATTTTTTTHATTTYRKTYRNTPIPTTSTTKVIRRPSDVSRYVSFSGGFADGRGLGNQIFCFAAVLYVAELTGREPAIEKFNYVIQLDHVFNLNVERFDSLCPCYWIEESKHLAFDEATDKKVLNNAETANKAILVGGFRQSWKYTLAINRRLRRHLVFKDEIQKFAETFLRDHIPVGWNRAGFIRVAIHIRRGDILTKRLSDYGYTFPSITYFKKAMSYFIDRYNQVQFITVSDDSKWTRENIHAEKSMSKTVNVTHSVGHSAGQDLAIISMCDHVIMTTGTYGWWGSWLAKGTTIYYSDWPRNGSGLEKQFRREDFFPPNWIPMKD